MKHICSRATTAASLASVAITVSACSGAPTEASGSAAQAASAAKTITLTATAFGSWRADGTRTADDYVTGLIDGDNRIGYYVFDLGPVAGMQVNAANLVLANPNGVKENITEPKPGLRTSIRPPGSTSVETLTTGNNDTSVFAQVAAESSQSDYTYSYLKAQGAGTITFDLLTYDSTRIPDLVASATSGTQFVVVSYATNTSSTAAVPSNGTGDEFAFFGTGAVAPQLVFTLGGS